MGFVFEGLLGATTTLAILYFILSVFLYYKMFWLQAHSSQGLNTRKLFAMSCLLTAILRCMSFSSMALLCIGRVDFSFNSDNLDPTDDKNNDDSSRDTYNFFEKSLIVLFDFPDFCYISAYVLLLIVWAETYLKSRRHWLSSIRYRRFWMLGYFIFNIILYGTQLALYSLLFIPQVNDSVLLDMIYLCLAAFSFFLPCAWLVIYFVLAIQFAGFPFSSPLAKERLKYLNFLGKLWTVTRVAWGLLALTAEVEGWLTDAQKSPLFYSILLIIIFVVTEIVPILVSVYKPVLQSLAEEPMVTPGTPHPYQPLRPNQSGIIDTENYEGSGLIGYLAADKVVTNPLLQEQPQPSSSSSRSQAESFDNRSRSSPIPIGNLSSSHPSRESLDSTENWSMASRSPHTGIWITSLAGISNVMSSHISRVCLKNISFTSRIVLVTIRSARNEDCCCTTKLGLYIIISLSN